MSRTLCLAVLVLSLLAAPSSPVAESDAQEELIARGPGKVQPLSEILALARRIAPGKVIDVELEYDIEFEEGQRTARWVYEIEVLTEDNRIVEMEFDAQTGQLIEIDGAPWPADIPREEP